MALATSISMKEYLKRYKSNDGEEEEKKIKTKPESLGVVVVDEDPVWQKPDQEKPLRKHTNLSPPRQRSRRRRHRHPTGERMSKEDYFKYKQNKPKDNVLEYWGKGLAQKREAEAKLQELDKPFARTRDDPNLDNMLKQKLRFGDPMAQYLANKKHPEAYTHF
ncbi:Bud13 [Corchorus olitorius]|uniref:Bud13 n=1 Tax=Corchorus olitorius TaxID=93759 RepID=A0A1R3GWU8_9ROSI|nr:Bud13 [Corchorus olitorius]